MMCPMPEYGTYSLKVLSKLRKKVLLFVSERGGFRRGGFGTTFTKTISFESEDTKCDTWTILVTYVPIRVFLVAF